MQPPTSPTMFLKPFAAIPLAFSLLNAAALAQSLDLPGPDGHVAVPASSTLVPQNGITVEAWITLDALTARPTIVRKNPTALAESYVLRVESGRPQFRVRTASGFYTLWPNTFITSGTAHHLAGTYDGVTTRLYLDGNQIGESTVNGGPLLDTGGELRIGKGDDVAFGEVFTGEIDSVRIWDHARKPHQIRDGLDRELPFAQGLIASWNFDGDWLDEAGGNHGTGVGANSFAPDLTYFAQAATFTGGPIEVPHNGELVPTTGLTVEAWIRPTSFVGRPAIVKVLYSPESYTLGLESGRLQWILNTVTGTHTLWALGTPLQLNTPMHVAATYDGVTMALYLDGQLIASMPAAFGALVPSTSQLHIGSSSVGVWGGPFLGSIDSLRIWSVARAADDISYLRNREVHSLPGMISSWNFNGNFDDSTGSNHGNPLGVGVAVLTEQFGPQTASIDDGLLTYGSPTSTCARQPRMFVGSLPETGNGGFAFGSTGGPSGGIYVNVLGTSALPAAVNVLGFDLLVDISMPYVTYAGIGSQLGACREQLGFTPTSVVGFEFAAQTVWFDPCGPAGFSASDGLRIRIVN